MDRPIAIVGVVAVLAATTGFALTGYIGHSRSKSPPWVYGDHDARFTIALYADIKCPYCRGYVPVLRAWIDRQHDVKLEWHHFPLEVHEPDATLAAIAAECAGRIGGSSAFWETAEALLAGVDPPQSPNPSKMATCRIDRAVLQWVQSQSAEATARGIQGTPTLRVLDETSNESVTLPGLVDGDALLSAIDLLTISEGESP